MKLLVSDESLEDAVYKHRKLLNSYHKSAVKHLRVALHSTPPVIEALHPLIQVLTFGMKIRYYPSYGNSFVQLYKSKYISYADIFG